LCEKFKSLEQETLRKEQVRRSQMTASAQLHQQNDIELGAVQQQTNAASQQLAFKPKNLQE